jgi:predicted nucleic acid-binding protein
MNKKIFVDTGAWFAIADKHDQFHRKASDHIKRIVENSNNLVTSNLVIHEATMLLSRTLSKEAASRF